MTPEDAETLAYELCERHSVPFAELFPGQARFSAKEVLQKIAEVERIRSRKSFSEILQLLGHSADKVSPGLWKCSRCGVSFSNSLSVSSILLPAAKAWESKLDVSIPSCDQAVVSGVHEE